MSGESLTLGDKFEVGILKNLTFAHRCFEMSAYDIDGLRPGDFAGIDFAVTHTFDFFAGDAAEILPEILQNAPADAVAVFDPPRGGLDGKAVRALLKSPLKKLIYISCHPATLVRDLGRLQQGGFAIKQVRMIDMFPRSAQFETFVQLAR